jgi:putative peptidoglycan lipid II flippase
MSDLASQHKEREHFFSAAKLMSALTVLSRIAGMLRAMAVASLGATALTDAFALAFRIPNLFRRLFAEGALSAAFVPIFTETLEQGPDGMEKGRKLLANSMALLTVLMCVLMVLLEIGLVIWAACYPGREDRELLIRLTSIMLPFMVTICMLALGSAALNCRGHFAYPAATPIILNMVIVAAAWFVAPLWKGNIPAQLTVIAVSVSVAGVLQLAGALWLLHHSGFGLAWRLRPIEPGIRPMLRQMAPMLIALGFLQLTELLESVLAWMLRADTAGEAFHVFGLTLEKPLNAGVLQRIDAARYLYQFPLGVLAISLGVAVFPLLSRYAARGDFANLRQSLNRALRLAFMEGIATGTGLFVLAEPITRLLYRHGRYTEADVQQSAFIVQMYCLGMWAYCTYQIFVRTFYAVKEARTPMRISCTLAGVHFVLVSLLIWNKNLGPGAFGLATAVTFSLDTLLQAHFLRKKLGRIGGRGLVMSIARSLVAAGAMAGAIKLLEHAMVQHGAKNWMVVAACVPAGAAVFVLVALVLRAPELAEFVGAVRDRKKKGDKVEIPTDDPAEADDV